MHFGQLAEGGISFVIQPIVVEENSDVPAGLSNVVAVAAGTWNSFALRVDGTAVGWGQFDYTLKTNAVPGVDWSGVTAIAAGQFHRLGLRADGTVVDWLDYADYSLNRVPAGLTNAVAIAAATRHSLALKAVGLDPAGDAQPFRGDAERAELA